jgi:hypothetical protein
MWISFFAAAIACAIFLNVAAVMMTVTSAKM